MGTGAPIREKTIIYMILFFYLYGSVDRCGFYNGSVNGSVRIGTVRCGSVFRGIVVHYEVALCIAIYKGRLRSTIAYGRASCRCAPVGVRGAGRSCNARQRLVTHHLVKSAGENMRACRHSLFASISVRGLSCEGVLNAECCVRRTITYTHRFMHA